MLGNMHDRQGAQICLFSAIFETLYTESHEVKEIFCKNNLLIISILTVVYDKISNRCYFQLLFVIVIESIHRIQNPV